MAILRVVFFECDGLWVSKRKPNALMGSVINMESPGSTWINVRADDGRFLSVYKCDIVSSAYIEDKDMETKTIKNPDFKEEKENE
jgi:hypothetical protein